MYNNNSTVSFKEFASGSLNSDTKVENTIRRKGTIRYKNDFTTVFHHENSFTKCHTKFMATFLTDQGKCHVSHNGKSRERIPPNHMCLLDNSYHITGERMKV